MEPIADGIAYNPSTGNFVSTDSTSLKDKTEIVIIRKSNPGLYNDKLMIVSGGIVLDSSNVQSEPDHPQLDTADRDSDYYGGTLPAGDYTGTLLNASGSYVNPIHLYSDELQEMGINAALIHPNAYTNPVKQAERQAAGQSIGPWNQAYSLACQITGGKEEGVDEYNEIVDTLKALGYRFGDGSEYESWIKGDTINVAIKNKENN